MGQNVQIFIFWAIFGALGVFNNQTRSILLISYHLTHIYVHVKYGSNLILYKKMLSLNPKYGKNILFHIWGGGGGGGPGVPYVKPR